MIIEALEKVLAGEDLSRAEAESAMEECFSGAAADAQAQAFMTALHMKGMTKEEKSALDEAAKRHPDGMGGSCAVGAELSATGYQYLVISKMLVIQGHDLSRREAENAMEDMLSGRAPAIEIAQFLAALRFKGETVDELVGFAAAMRRHATPIFAPGQRTPEPLVDTCGTGGDARGTFNVSTAAAFVVAGAGVHVAKHGNRSISSRCGSADVLEELGVRIDLPPERVGRAIEEVGIGFLFAPAVHAATRHAMPVRRELKVRTVFNLLGPLTNPAGASAQVAGVYDASFTELMAKALGELGVRRAFVVHGADGLDEISLSGETSVAELRDRVVRSYTVAPEDFGLRRAPLEADPRRRRKAQRGDHSSRLRASRPRPRARSAPRHRPRQFRRGSGCCGPRQRFPRWCASRRRIYRLRRRPRTSRSADRFLAIRTRAWPHAIRIVTNPG